MENGAYLIVGHVGLVGADEFGGPVPTVVWLADGETSSRL